VSFARGNANANRAPEEKLLAAHAPAVFTTVLIPEENEKSLADIPDNV